MSTHRGDTLVNSLVCTVNQDVPVTIHFLPPENATEVDSGATHAGRHVHFDGFVVGRN